MLVFQISALSVCHPEALDVHVQDRKFQFSESRFYLLFYTSGERSPKSVICIEERLVFKVP